MVLILNGDSFLQADLQKFATFHQDKKSDLSIVLRHLEDCNRYGKVAIDNNIITRFSEKTAEKDPNKANEGFINGGIYLLNPKILAKYNFPKQFSFEQDFLGKYMSQIKAYGFLSQDYFIDIGVPQDYQKSQNDLPNLIKNKALFLDRDGVINIDHGHVGKIKDFHFIEEIFKLCKKAENAGYLIIIITNQAGIAKGYYSEEQFLELTKWMEGEFAKRRIKITKTYYCPYHKEAKIEKYKQDSLDRKPNPGMLLKAIKKFNIDPKKSIMIGDKESDMIAAIKAKIKTRVFFNSYSKKSEQKYNQVDNLLKIEI